MRVVALAAAGLFASGYAHLAEAQPAQPSASATISASADAYLREAISAFRQKHINRDKVDWDAVTAKAFAAAAGAQTPADTYKAIQLIIRELGERHTSFIPADQAKANSTGAQSGNSSPPPLDLPEGERLLQGAGIVRLMAFMGSKEQGREYAAAAQNILRRLERSGVCGYLVDIRYDAGGNMWPMLNGLTGLFRDGVLGTFENTDGERTNWLRKDGAIFEQGTAAPASAERVTPFKRPDAPVAVLIGNYTASSGEFTAMAFEGRPHTRFFGQPTAGYVTANNSVTLSDGAQILMTSGWGSDRSGKKYVDRIIPDQVTGRGGPTMDAALNWLRSVGCPSVRGRRPIV